MWSSGIILLLVCAQVLPFGTNCGSSPHDPDFEWKKLPYSEPRENLRVAYIGDVGVREPSKAVYTLIKEFQTDFVVHSGDFDYNSDPSIFERQIDDILGPDMPYFASVGNHELDAWHGPGGYQDLLIRRMMRQNLTQYCTGELGVMEACFYEGILFTITGPGTLGCDHADFIDRIFSETPAKWKVCSFHKNQRLMQIELKSDETGWPVYEVCNDHGAMIVTGHAHVLCRTHLMGSYERTEVLGIDGQTPDNPLILRPGVTFNILSGVSGQSLRASDEEQEFNPWWAVAYASNYNMVNGCYLCTYNVDGRGLSVCEFVDIELNVWDTFYFDSAVPADKATKSDRTCEAKRIERQISASQNDAVVEGGNVKCETISLGGHSLLTFDAIPLNGENAQDIEYAFLEIHGANDGDGSSIDIRVLDGPSPKLTCDAPLSDEFTRSPAVSWTAAPEDREMGDVWVSPDISAAIKTVVSRSDWTSNSALGFELLNDGSNEFSSFDKSKCLGASLIIQMTRPC